MYSLTKQKNSTNQNNLDEKKHVSVVVSLFLLSQVFLIVSHGPLVRTLAAIILKSDSNIVQSGVSHTLEDYNKMAVGASIGFAPPTETLEKSLESLSGIPEAQRLINEDSPPTTDSPSLSCTSSDETPTSSGLNAIQIDNIDDKIKHLNVTDEEKEQRLALEIPLSPKQLSEDICNVPIITRPFLDTILNSLHCTENDYATLFGLCLLYALISNHVSLHNKYFYLLFS